MKGVLLAASLVAGALAAGAAVYLAALAVACGISRRRPRSSPGAPAEPTSRLAVLVPAHNESELIERCVRSLQGVDYPESLIDIVVIADNCDDDTAALARAAGASVYERIAPDDRGKGQALRWAMDRLLAERTGDERLDGVVVVDADSVVDPGMVRALERRLAAGHQAVQAEYLMLDEEGTPKAALRAAAILLFHRVRFTGRAALGMPCHLVGNGMLFSRSLIETHPWHAFTSAEDLEYAVDLRLAGVKTVYAADAGIQGPMPTDARAQRTQRTRWEGGRFHVVRTRLPRMAKQILTGKVSLLDAFVDLAVPPLGILGAMIVAGLVGSGVLAAVGALPLVGVAPWAVAAVALGAFVLLGLWAADAPRATYRALLLAPAFVAKAMGARLHLVRGLEETTWERTQRPGELEADDEIEIDLRDGAEPMADVAAHTTLDRYLVGGVPVDAIDVHEALRRVGSAMLNRTFMQVCTVNLDFLVNARKDRRVRDVLFGADLNIADGAPVLWLGRVLGLPQKERIAGADFVPLLMSTAAPLGKRVFLLGGEEGSAHDAADYLKRAYPSLTIAGVYEPPVASLENFDHEDILGRIHEAETDILLVALGHPKQERWIAMNREQLPDCIAVGVGCTFDLLAGRRRRAPEWMREHGLEWLYRFTNEPARLGKRYIVDGITLLTVLFPLSVVGRFSNRRAPAVEPARSGARPPVLAPVAGARDSEAAA